MPKMTKKELESYVDDLETTLDEIADKATDENADPEEALDEIADLAGAEEDEEDNGEGEGESDGDDLSDD